MTLFGRLLAEPGVREDVVLRSRFGFMAFHGGSLEQMTEVVAEEAAQRAGASAYVVALPEGLRWHVPSRLVGAAPSDGLAEFLGHVDVVVAVHGYGRAGRWTSLLLGGPNRVLARHLARHLTAALPHYEALDDLDAIPADLRGLHPDNPVSLVPHGGVQLELPPRVRGIGPRWADWAGPGLPPDTDALVTALAAAAVAWDGEAPPTS